MKDIIIKEIEFTFFSLGSHTSSGKLALPVQRLLHNFLALPF